MVRGILETGDSPASTSVDKIVATFNKYKDQSTGSIEVEGMQKFVPDVPVAVEPTLMKRWHKEAGPVYDAKSRLVPWDPRA